MAPVMLWQSQHRDAVALDRLDRHEVLGIDPPRHVEQRASAMVRLSFRRQGRPGGITEGFVQRRYRSFSEAATWVAKDFRLAGRRSELPGLHAERGRRSRGIGYFFTA